MPGPVNASGAAVDTAVDATAADTAADTLYTVVIQNVGQALDIRTFERPETADLWAEELARVLDCGLERVLKVAGRGTTAGTRV